MENEEKKDIKPLEVTEEVTEKKAEEKAEETSAPVLKCPFCDGTEMIEAYQGGYAHIYAVDSSLRGSCLYHLICRDCGTVVRSFVKDPEKFVKMKNRRKKESHYTKTLTDYC